MTTEHSSKDPQCEGTCAEHRGPIVQVRVLDEDAGHDWGTFYYCQEAIDVDRDNGLVVDILEAA